MVRGVAANITTDSPSDSRTDIVGILDDLTSVRDSLPGPPCSVGVAVARIAAQDVDVAVQVEQRINDQAYPAAGVAQVLTDRTGVSVSAYTLRRHRKRGTVNGCRCPQ